LSLLLNGPATRLPWYPRPHIEVGFLLVVHLFELRLMGPLEARQSLDVDRRPWEEGLKLALAPANWVALYRSTTGLP
jgi:hypothetical protein